MANKVKSGGGIQSNKCVNVPVRVGRAREGINVVAVSRLGAMQGNHVTERGRTLRILLSLSALAQCPAFHLAMPRPFVLARAGLGRIALFIALAIRNRQGLRHRCRLGGIRSANSVLIIVAGDRDDDGQAT
jgi:hypothetical protein